MTASEAEVDEALSAALQRSHSTPEPLFGHAHLDFTNSSGLNQHDLLPNGNKNEPTWTPWATSGSTFEIWGGFRKE